MKKIVTIILVVLGSVSLSADGEKRIIGKIVNIAAPQSIIVDCNLTNFSDQCWTPTEQHIKQLETKLFQFIVNRLKSQQQKLRKPLFKYHRQYAGDDWRDRKVIIVRGFLDVPSSPNNRDYFYSVYYVLDGCDTFFIAKYDVEADRFVDFGFCCGGCF